LRHETRGVLLAGSGDDPDVVLSQVSGDHAAEIGIVIDDQHLFRHGFTSLGELPPRIRGGAESGESG
jgi:hypothetical protein